MTSRVRAALLLAGAVLVAAPAAHAALHVRGLALPDTGLFAPVAAQYRARTEMLDNAEWTHVTPTLLMLQLRTGRVDEAASALPTAELPDSVVADALLARQSFADLEPVMARLAAAPAPGPAARMLEYAWLRARDDAPRIDSLARARLAAEQRPEAQVPELLALARLAYDTLDDARAESLYTRALESIAGPEPGEMVLQAGPGTIAQLERSAALTGLGRVLHHRRDFDASFARLRQAIATRAVATSDALEALAQTLIRLGRTDDAISAAQWAVAIAPYDDAPHYLLGNGYARRNYTELLAAYPDAFADAAGRRALAAADARLARGDRSGARAAYRSVAEAHPGWADAQVRLASLDFEDGAYASARDRCFSALRLCPEYGRAHAVLAKALESQRFTVDVHRADYERRFAAAPMPQVPGIERFVLDWASLSPRHQKRVALSIAPWKAFVPVLVEGGASFYVKPLYMRLSECPDQQALKDQRIDYDSRLWDDVRGCGGYHTVTGIEDVERTIFDRYNTVLHELTHQVHGVLPADDARLIEEHYRRAKARDDATHDGFLSRYAGGSFWEYFAEGANALYSPRRDAYDPREVVRERLDRIDPDLRALVERFLARTDVSASYPVAYVNAGDDRIERGRVAAALPYYRRALARVPDEETALRALARALTLTGDRKGALEAAERAVRAHPTSGATQVAAAEAAWHSGTGLAAARAALDRARPAVRRGDLLALDLETGRLAWVAGDTTRALAAYDSALARQSDSPEALRGRAETLALAGRWDDAFAWYDRAVRMRTGIVDLRDAYARDLLRAGRLEAAEAQLDEARLLDPRDPDAEALRGWLALARGAPDSARARARRALEWGDWSDLARIVLGAAEARRGDAAAARAAWAPVERRIAENAPPAYVYRESLSTWEEVHVLPAVERATLRELQRR